MIPIPELPLQTSDTSLLSETSFPKSYDLLRAPNGEPLQGFAKDFLSNSIATTLQFPQTQAVIKIAVAASIIRAIVNGQSLEIKQVWSDLKNNERQIINLELIAEFVDNVYKQKELPIPPVPTDSYRLLFLHELNIAFQLIAVYAKLENSPPEAKSIGQEMIQAYSGPNGTITAESAVTEILLPKAQELPISFCNKILEVFDQTVQELKKDSRLIDARKFLEDGIRTTPREELFLSVIFPYGSFVTKTSDILLFNNWQNHKA